MTVAQLRRSPNLCFMAWMSQKVSVIESEMMGRDNVGISNEIRIVLAKALCKAPASYLLLAWYLYQHHF